MGATTKDWRGRALWLWPARIVAASAVAAVLSYLPYRLVTASGDQKLQAMKRELARTRSEIAERHEDNRERRQQVEALKKDTKTIENIAREELQMLYPHEKTLRLDRGPRGAR